MPGKAGGGRVRRLRGLAGGIVGLGLLLGGCGRERTEQTIPPPATPAGSAPADHRSTAATAPTPPATAGADAQPPLVTAPPVPAPLPAATGAITPPTQPATGPGGKDYAHKYVVKTAVGSGGTAYWLFEPAGPAPEQAPVVVFCHGWGAMIPEIYQAWIDHLVKRGNIVIYPRYQDSFLTKPEEFTPNAITAVRDGLQVLAGAGHVHPDLTRVATVGHSYGGIVCANLAAQAAAEKLPKFLAVMPVEPGANHFGRPYGDYGQIPAGTLLLCVAGEEDHLVRQVDALKIFREATAVLPADKNYLLARGDRRGSVTLSANHLAPVCGRGGAQPWQWYGYWKWFDGLTDAAFYEGKNRKYALGDTAEQKDMGRWSDGTAVKPPVVTVGKE